MSKTSKIILGLLTIFVATLFLGIPQYLYKRVALIQTYNRLVSFEENNNHKAVYELILPEDRKQISFDEFSRNRTSIYSYDVKIHKVEIEDNIGTIERTIKACYTKTCEGKNKTENTRRIRFFFQNGRWYTPVNNRVYCSRKEPYQKPPEFERALSLVIQRYAENEPSKQLAQDIASIQNCLSIEYTTRDNDLEGYFLFDPSLTNSDYYPIFVSTRYKQVDDISTAVLLAHEITHVIQFLNGKDNCINNEVNAFFDQYNFVLSLNEEEKRTLLTRINEIPFWQTDANPQIEITSDLLNLSYEAQQYCNTTELNSCWRSRFLNLLQTRVENSPYYQKQCSHDV